MTSSVKMDEIKAFLPQNEPFTRELIMQYFVKKGEALTEQNLKVRVNRLKSRGIIVNVSRGWYKVNDKKLFSPDAFAALKKLSSLIRKRHPLLDYSIWSTSWLNHFSSIQQVRNSYIIEVEAGAEDSVFGIFKEVYPMRTFLNPSEEEWSNYISERNDSIILKTMISESPKENYHNISMARLEKILVDIYCDKLWQNMFSEELHNIYKDACTNYVLNFSTLLSYAARRGKRSEIWDFIKTQNSLDQQIISLIER